MRYLGSMNISQNGVDMIKSFEGFRSSSYLDSVGVPTIGYGTTHINGIPVHLGNASISEAQAEVYLRKDLEDAVKAVNKLVHVEINQNQFDALVSFVYNLGAGALASSHLLTYLNGKKYISAGDEFHKWDKGHINGKLVQIAGLTKRRLLEEKLFNTTPTIK